MELRRTKKRIKREKKRKTARFRSFSHRPMTIWRQSNANRWNSFAFSFVSCSMDTRARFYRFTLFLLLHFFRHSLLFIDEIQFKWFSISHSSRDLTADGTWQSHHRLLMSEFYGCVSGLQLMGRFFFLNEKRVVTVLNELKIEKQHRECDTEKEKTKTKRWNAFHSIKKLLLWKFSFNNLTIRASFVCFYISHCCCFVRSRSHRSFFVTMPFFRLRFSFRKSRHFWEEQKKKYDVLA